MRKKIILIVTVVFMLLTTMFLPMTNGNNTIHAETSVSTWQELSDAVSNAVDGDVIVIKADLVADKSITLDKDNISIKIQSDGTHYIYRKKDVKYDSMFIVTSGQLTLGDGLVLSGKTVKCEKKDDTLDDLKKDSWSVPGDAEVKEVIKENNHTKEEYKVIKANSVTASFTTGKGNWTKRDGDTSTDVGLYNYGPTDFEIDNNSFFKLNGMYVYSYGSGNYKLNNNTDKALYLADSNDNKVLPSDIQIDQNYFIRDPNIGGFLYWDGSALRSGGNSENALEFKANNVTSGTDTETYYMIPVKQPIGDESSKQRFEIDDPAADTAITTLNNEIDPKHYWESPDPEDTKEYGTKDEAQVSADAYNEAHPKTVNGWIIDGVKFVDPDDVDAANAALQIYNQNKPVVCDPDDAACPIDDNGVYTKDSFTGKVGDEYTPKGFFVHVEDRGKAILDGATLENFITSRNKDTSPKFVAPVVANGENASFDVFNGTIQNNTVGYIVNDAKANESADKIKYYIKGATPNAIRAKDSERRNRQAEIDGNDPGSGITATAGAIIYAGGAQGEIKGGKIKLNRGDTGGIMATGEKTTVTLREGTDIDSNVGVQFGGGVTTEAGAKIKMYKGIIQNNVAWFGGGGVYATENGVQWLLGKVEKTQRKDGIFEMYDGIIDGNTAFTRGGGFFVDSDGVSILKGVIKNNMSRMIGGGMYVMGDHADYTYTVFINTGYVHDNKAISAGQKTDVATNSKIDPDNKKVSQKLSAPCNCEIPTEEYKLLNGVIDNVNTDDLTDGYPKEGSDGTGGGIWLCAYGSTVLNMEDDVFIIDKNYATGSSTQGKAAQTINSNAKDSTSSNKAGGNDIHKETKANGSIVVYGIKANDDSTVQWHDENTGEWYTDPAKADEKGSIADFSLRNLTNMGDHKPEGYSQGNYNGVDVYGNISRRGGGLAADGTFVFGNIAAMGDAYSELAVTKTWAGGIEPQNVTIRIYLEYEEDGQTKTLDVIELPLSDVIGENDSELDTAFTDGSKEVDGKTVYLGHIILPITVEDENGKQIQLFDLLDDKGNTFAMNKATGLLALGEYLEGKGKVTLSNAKRKLKFVELIDDGTGKLVEAEGFELTPSEMKLSTNPAPTFHKEKIEILQEDGTYVDKGTVITSDVRFEAALYNDKPAEIEKYVNKAVHKDIELDEEFEYDIIAYVKHGTDKLILLDELVEDLEFVSKEAEVQVTSLDNNNHYPLNDITGKQIHNDASVNQTGTSIANKTVKIENNKLTVTIENKLDKVIDAKDNVIGYKNAADGQDLTALWGKWVKVTYKAQIKKDLQNQIKNGQMSLSELSSVTVKADEVFRSKNSIFKDKDRPKPNVGNKPVGSTQDHTGIENTASYTLEVKNKPEFRDESNTVTVKPGGDYKKIDVKKVWDDSDNTSKLRPVEIVVNLYRDGALYKEATLNDDNGWKYSFTGLPEDGEYTIEERKVDKYITVIKGDAEKGFEITNSYREYFPDREFDVDQCGEYVLTKNGSGNISKNTEFTFNVTMIIDKGLSTEKTYKDTLKLKVGESKTYDFVVADTQITVEEVSSDNYDVTYYLDDEKVTETMTIISKGKTSNFEIFNSSKEKPPIPKTGIE